MLRRILLSIVATLALCTTASACDGCGSWQGWQLPARLPLRIGNLPTPPYFALHPPVYYGQMMRRPYGDSPYAYAPMRPHPPIVRMPASKPAPEPKMIVNPFVARQDVRFEPAEGANEMIRNPYVTLAGN